MFVANIVPGQGFQQFKIFTQKGGLDNTGRPIEGVYIKTENDFYAMLINASEKEIEQGKQNGHPVTHKIVEYSAIKKAKATDVLVLSNGRQFYIQGTKNHADMNICMTYMVEERKDMKLIREVDKVTGDEWFN